MLVAALPVAVLRAGAMGRMPFAPLRMALLVALVLVILDALASLALPLLVRDGVNAALEKHRGVLLGGAAAIALLVVLGDWLVTIAQTRVAGRLGERLLYTLRVKTFAQLQRLGLDYYEREMAGRTARSPPPQRLVPRRRVPPTGTARPER